ncbi:MAG: DUF6325 family protein [Candidatus Saccharibacteria bacterium]
MRGPIDYIVVGFPGNKFKGEVLEALSTAVANGTIAVLDIALILKDEKGEVTEIEINAVDDAVVQKLMPDGVQESGLIQDDDVEEIASVLDNNCSAGLLIVEQLWAKDIKQALINANGVLLAEGRIHPEAYEEITHEKGGK